MKTYQEQKTNFIQSLCSRGLTEHEVSLILEGMSVSEKLLENCVRDNMEPYVSLVRALDTINDTKKESKKISVKEQIPEILSKTRGNIEKLLNISRL